MRKEWKKPELEVLEISMTMMGPGIRDVDAVIKDDDEVGYLHKS